MKSAHRHELQTNELAQRLDLAIERFKPYAATVAGVIVAIVVVMFIWSYVAGSSASRSGAAWDAYHRGVASVPPNLEQLKGVAEEYPGTQMQQLADITWADGQVLMASREYIYNRASATEALGRATSTYQSILQTSDDERLENRAHLGLARVYEMENELDKAREEYLKVQGGYQGYAKLQAERLDKPETKETYAWLATAQAPRPRAPMGPGTPGERPEFSPGEFALPGTDTESGSTQPGLDPGAPTTGAAPGESFEDLIQGLQLPTTEGSDRYDTSEPPGEVTDSQPAADDTSQPPVESSDAQPPADDAPKSESESGKEAPATK